MALADPQSVTINSVANPLARISVGNNTSTYKNADGSIKLTINHNYGRRDRHLVRLDFEKVGPDPITGVNQRFSMSTYTVIDAPPAGFTVKETTDVLAGLTSFLAVSGTATRLVGGES